MIRRRMMMLSTVLSLLSLPLLNMDQASGPAWGAESHSAKDDSLGALYAPFLSGSGLKRGKLSPADELWSGWTWEEQRDCLKWLSQQRREKFRHEDIEIEIDGELMAEIKEGVTICYSLSGVTQTKDLALVGQLHRADHHESSVPDSTHGSDNHLESNNDGTAASDAVSVDRLPEVKSIPEPEYPFEASQSGMTGVVVTRVLIGKNGRVRSIIVDSGPSVFYRSAVEAVREARFVPAQYQGAPVAVWILLPIRFALVSR